MEDIKDEKKVSIEPSSVHSTFTDSESPTSVVVQKDEPDLRTVKTESDVAVVQGDQSLSQQTSILTQNTNTVDLVVEKTAASTLEAEHIEKTAASTLEAEHIEKTAASTVEAEHIENTAASTLEAEHIEKTAASTLEAEHIENTAASTLDAEHIKKTAASTLEAEHIEKTAASTLEAEHIEKTAASTVEAEHIENTVASTLEAEHIEKTAASTLEAEHIENTAASILEAEHIKKTAASTLEAEHIEKTAASTLEAEHIKKTAASTLEAEHIEKTAASTLEAEHMNAPEVDMEVKNISDTPEDSTAITGNGIHNSHDNSVSNENKASEIAPQLCSSELDNHQVERGTPKEDLDPADLLLQQKSITTGPPNGLTTDLTVAPSDVKAPDLNKDVSNLPDISENSSHVSESDVKSNSDSTISDGDATRHPSLSNELGDRQVEEETPEKVLAPDSQEQHKPSPPDGSNMISHVDQPVLSPSDVKLKDIKTPVSLDSAENGTSSTDVRSGGDTNASLELKSAESTPQSTRSSEFGESQDERGTPKKVTAFTNSSAKTKKVRVNVGIVDTAAPFESVKEAVSKFGGIVDWKAHKSQALERRKYVQAELSKTQEEIPQYKKQAEAAEAVKAQVLDELERTKRLIEELKLNLEKAQTEEAQAKQDSELAQLRIKEIEQGIAGEASVAAKAQLDVAKSRHAAAVADLKKVTDELKQIQEEYVSLASEKDTAVKNAEEAISASKAIEKSVEDLMLDLIAAREALELARAAHMEAEEHRIGAALARDQDSLSWEKELQEKEKELQQLEEKLLSAKDLQSKFDTAFSQLQNLKLELAAYMEAQLNQESDNISEDRGEGESEELKKIRTALQDKIDSANKKLEEVKGNIEKANEEVNILKVAAVSLKFELETERAALAALKQREGMATIVVSSLEAELNRTKAEIEQVQEKEKEAREQMMELPKSLQRAAMEADEAKSMAEEAREELRRAKEESEQAKASASTVESRLRAASKEIDASKASERLALAAIKALQESESNIDLENSSSRVTLPLEEYYALSKRAHDAEEQANEKVDAALSKIVLAKESESKSLDRLELANKELDESREALRLAAEKAQKAKEGKLGVEQELRMWRAENERRRKATIASEFATNSPRSPRRSLDMKDSKLYISGKEAAEAAHSSEYSSDSDAASVGAKTKKKKSLFPRIIMFLAKKSHSVQK